MKKRFLLILCNVLILGSLVAIVDGCASTPPSYNAAASHMPRLRAGYARVIFYCNEPANVARQHDFVCYLDDGVVGHLNGWDFLFADHRAGRCEVKAKTSNNSLLPAKHIKLDLEPGDVRYVQLQMKNTYPPDVHLGIVDAEKAQEDVEGCRYVGHLLTPSAAR